MLTINQIIFPKTNGFLTSFLIGFICFSSIRRGPNTDSGQIPRASISAATTPTYCPPTKPTSVHATTTADDNATTAGNAQVRRNATADACGHGGWRTALPKPAHQTQLLFPVSRGLAAAAAECAECGRAPSASPTKAALHDARAGRDATGVQSGTGRQPEHRQCQRQMALCSLQELSW